MTDIKNMDNEELLAEYGRALKDLHTSRNPDAADRAIDAGAEILSRMQEWVSVEERLLEDEGRYLIFSANRERGFEIDFSFYSGTTRNIAWWKAFVTHWSPLPQPPKEG